MESLPPYGSDESAVRMFWTFAQMEYALKAVKAFRTVKKDRSVGPNWRKFAETIDADFNNNQDANFTEAVNFLINKPPGRQIQNDLKELHWDYTPCNGTCRADVILAHVRRVRNNLFHGGKFHGVYHTGERAEELLTHSLCVMHVSVNLHEEVREAFESLG